MSFKQFRGESRPRFLSILILILVAQICFGVYHDGSISTDPPPNPPPGEDSDGDSDSGDPAGEDGESPGDGDPAGDEEPTQEEMEAAIEAETERILAELAAAAEGVRGADEAISRLLAAAVNDGRIDPADDLTDSVARYVEAGRNGYDAIARANAGAWEAQHNAAGTRRSALERDLGISGTPHQGDPVRVFDGAYITSLPLPVLRFGQTVVDLSVEYDSNRAVKGSWGRGWTDITEERVIVGSIRPPAIGAAIASALDEAESRHDAILDLVRTVVPGVTGRDDIAAVRSQLIARRDDIESAISSTTYALVRTNQIRDIAVTWGLPTRELDRGITEANEIRRRAIGDRETVDRVLPFLSHSGEAVHDNETRVAGIQEFDRILTDATARWSAVEDKNRSVLLPGTEPDAASIGTDYCVYVDRLGRRHLFHREENHRYRSPALPYVDLIQNDNGWELRSPDGEIRTFGPTGYISSVSSRNGGAVTFVRGIDGAATDVELLGPAGRTLARYRYIESAEGDATVTLSIPTLDEHHFNVDDTGIVSVASPRGTVTYHYAKERIVDISRGDDRTAVEYDTSHRVVAVTYPTGGREEFSYPTGTKRVYRDPDGVTTETVYEGEHLVEERRSNGYRREWKWQDDRIIEESDNRGRFRQFAYDDAGALRLEQFADGSWIRLDRNPAGFPVRLASDVGTHWETERDPQGRIVAIRTPEYGLTISGDPGPAATVTVTNDRGGRWCITYDDRSIPIRIERGDGRIEEFVSDVLGRIETHRVDGEVVTHIEYATDGRPRLVAENGRTTSFRYDDASPRNVTTLIGGDIYSTATLDGDDNVIRRAFFDETSEEFVYTSGGNLVEYTNRSGVTFNYRHDGVGNLIAITASEIGGEWRFEYDETGRRTGQLFPDGSRIRSLYNANGQAIGRSYPNGSIDLRERLPGGRIRRVSPSGRSQLLRYDAAGRPIRIVDEDGEAARIEYDGLDERWSVDGKPFRTIVYDPYGRRIEQVYVDGTSDRYRYETGSLPVHRIDRRGGAETWRWDDHDRCVYHRDAAGNEERWFYEADRTRYIGPHGEETIVQFDLEGRPVTVHDGNGSSSYRYRSDGVLVVTGHDGREIERHFNPIRRSTALDPFSPLSPSLPIVTKGESAFATSSLQHHVLSLFGRTYRIDLDPNGHIRNIGVGDGPTIGCEVDPLGYPRSVTGNGGNFAAEWGADGTLLEWTPPRGSTRRYQYDRFGTIRSWTDALGEVGVDADPADRTLHLHVNDPPRVTRSISFDPYGAVTRDEQVGRSGEHTIVSTERDLAGRVTAISGSGVSAELNAAYADHDVTIDVGIYHMRCTPGGDGTLNVQITTDTGERHAIEIDSDHCRYNGDLTIERTGEGCAKFLARRPSGVETTVDAYVSLFDSAGRRTLEHDLAGTVYGYRYDRSGRVVAIATNAPVSSGPQWRGTGHASTRISSPAELAERWSSIDVSRPPSVPLQLTEFGFVADDTERTVNSRGQIERIETTEIRYDPITDRGWEITTEERAWRLIRGIDGAPVVLDDHSLGHRYSVLHHEVNTGGRQISIRYWERRERENAPFGTNAFEPRGDAGWENGADRERDRRDGRYRPGEPRNPATEQDSPGVIVALEIRIGHIPVAYLDGDRLLVPFCDDRGSIRGLYDTDSTIGDRAYSRCTESVPFLVMGSSHRFEIGNTGELPRALPYETVVAGNDRLRGTDVLLTRERIAIPSIASFNRPDPDLDGIDWYQFCSGDTVNYIDVTGRFVVPVDSDHYQQDEEWSTDPLGSSASITIGNAGCKLVTVSNAINQIAGGEVTDPGTLNTALTDIYYTDDCLLSSNDAAHVMTAATGHEVAYVAVEPDRVDIDRVIETIADDPVTRYVVSARIRTYSDEEDGDRSVYEHSLNVTGFDSAGRPLFRDTSRRDRTSLGTGESVVRYDVYATSKCRVY